MEEADKRYVNVDNTLYSLIIHLCLICCREVASPFWRSLSDGLRQGRVERWFPVISYMGQGTPNCCVETHPLVVLLQVFEFVQLPELFYAGSHGMDIMGPADGCNGFKATGTRGKDKKVCQHPFSVPIPVIFCQPSFKLE